MSARILAPLAFSIIAAIALGFALGFVATSATPYCPTEDSCIPEYDGVTDTWSIREVTP